MPLQMDFTAADEEFRGEVQAFLAAELDDELRAAGREYSGMFAPRHIGRKWQQRLNKKGWGAIHWPTEYGGPGFTPAQQFIFREECAKAGVPSTLNMGASLLAPALFAFATDEQKAHYLPKILSGEHYWCQGYSEPGSGSDLASLQTRAVRDGDDYVINGTKIWTTHAQYADHIFALVRTRTDGKPQQGITFVLFPMDSPGVRVEPIITLAGDHEVNQVFFDDVRVPVANRVGEENQGWTVAKHLLQYERGSGGAAAGLKIGFDELRRVASQEGPDGRALISDADFARRLTELEISLQALEFSELSTLARLVAGDDPGSASSSVFKISSVDVAHAMETLRVEASAMYAMPNHGVISLNGNNQEPIGPHWSETAMADYLTGRAASIYGGSHQVQRNIIAKVELGL